MVAVVLIVELIFIYLFLLYVMFDQEQHSEVRTE